MDAQASSTNKESDGNWLDYLVELGAQRTTKGDIASFGLPEQEYSALKENAVLVPLLSNTPLKITGEDRVDFLHGQVSNDVKGLKESEHNTSLMLNVKGHVLAQMQIFRRAEDLFVAVEGNAGELVEKQFKAHIIFDQVNIHNLKYALASMTLLGSNAKQTLEQALGKVPKEDNFIYVPLASGKVLINSSQRSLHPAFDLHVLKKDAKNLFEKLLREGATPAGEELLNIARVEAGIASATYEGGEGTLPQEVGLEKAVSYKKGCYLGQEIMARIEARGNVRKELVTLLLEELPADNEKVIVANGKNVGKICTLVNHPEKGYMALASLRKDVEDSLTIANIRAQKALDALSTQT